MGRRTLAVAAVGLGAALSAACEDETPGDAPVAGFDGGGGTVDGGPRGPGTPPPSGAATDFCDKTMGVVHRALETCCTATDKETDLYGFLTGILTSLTPVCVDTLQASIDRGRVAYHQDRAEACFAAYEATFAPSECSKLTQTYADPAGTACREAYSGTGGVSAPCAGDHECEDGLTCVGHTRSADGACTSPPAVGEPCGPGVDDGGSRWASSLEFGVHPACASGARCDYSTRTCVAAAGAGQACNTTEDCTEGLRCYVGKCSSEGPSAANGPCLSRDDCEPGLFCDGETDTCAPKRAAGGACINTTFESECSGRCEGDPGQPGTCAAFCGSP